ncbi:MAG: hypothetical protein A2Y10_19745 [Planctomycetes bacterium GWF2_41_51]|nr:MAG: hypothetical protein A2Y10_19745 [Planctomycetes bacterium GWF2_41_51]HBG28213.1 hypothetical protein [Phycisphaerales bacterium]
MPSGNGTGPMGAGPMTGRGLGRCTGFVAGGFGRGRGMGLRNRFGARNPRFQPAPVITKEHQLQSLRQDAEILEAELKEIKSQIEQLKD